LKVTTHTKDSSKLSVTDKTPESHTQDPIEWQSRIAVSAYYKAQARGFEPGRELEDWLAAEKEESQ